VDLADSFAILSCSGGYRYDTFRVLRYEVLLLNSTEMRRGAVVLIMRVDLMYQL